MAWEEILESIGSLTAAADLSAAGNQHKAVKMAGDGTVGLASAGSDLVIGVLQNKPALGAAAAVAVKGVTKLRLGASVTFGQRLVADANGCAVPSTTATDIAFAIALESVALAATATGDELVAALLTGPYWAGNAS